MHYLEIAVGMFIILLPFWLLLRLLLKARREDQGYGNGADMPDIGPTTGL